VISRREFLAIAAASVRLKADPAEERNIGGVRRQPDQQNAGVPVRPDHARQRGRPRGSEFVFARLRYESGDWDYNPKVAANVLDSIVQYTSIPVYKEEVVISASSREIVSFPFVFMTGHKLVRFSSAERENLRIFADAGGLLFSDDCNHDVNGLYAKSFEQEMHVAFPADALAKLPASHPIYRSFFTFSGPPQTSHELVAGHEDEGKRQ